jgi:hypothetical protein
MRHHRDVPSRSGRDPRRAIDRTGDPNAVVGSTEAARRLGYSRPEKLPTTLLDLADVERNPDGSIRRRTWTLRTLWHFADVHLAAGATTIDGRAAVDRAGIAERAGVTVPAVAAWIAGRARNGFPEPIEADWYAVDAIDTWIAEHARARVDRLTRVDRSGGPDELVTKTEVARIVGYDDARSLDNSPLYATLLERNRPEHNEPLPSGRQRRRWPRRVVWDVADTRTNRRGRPRGATAATRTVDRSGDADELVGASEASRVLGYRHPSGLPGHVLERADVPGAPRQWRRSTLWAIADESTT